TMHLASLLTAMPGGPMRPVLLPSRWHRRLTGEDSARAAGGSPGVHHHPEAREPGCVGIAPLPSIARGMRNLAIRTGAASSPGRFRRNCIGLPGSCRR
ncbi:MAG: hypothetical protein ACREYC_26260, partial [Gammaproteobacteria bacterium]